jgi:uncharacterized protein (DUF4415 family)
MSDEMRQAELKERARQAAAVMTEDEDRKLHDAALADPDNPPIEDCSGFAPASAELKAAFAAAQAHARRTRGKQKAPTKRLVSIRLSREVIDHFRALGPGWQSRIDDALKRLIGG